MAESGVETLRRWADGGAQWRLVSVEDDRAVVDLLTCHGERVDRLESNEPELVTFVREHPRGGAFGDA